MCATCASIVTFVTLIISCGGCQGGGEQEQRLPEGEAGGGLDGLDNIQRGRPHHYPGQFFPPTTLPDFLCFLMQELGGATVHLVENLPRQLENSSLSKSSALGLLGIPGLTAYIGLMEIGKPKVTALAMVSQE